MSGVKIGDAFINVSADTDKAEADILALGVKANDTDPTVKVKADTEEAKLKIDEAARNRTSDVKVNASGNGLSWLGNLGKAAGTSALSITGLTTKFGLMGIGAVGAASNALTLAGSLVTVAGAGLALPGLLLGAGVGMGVLMAAMKDAPTVLAGVGVQMHGLQQSISKSFWDEAAQPIRDLVSTVLPQLKEGLGGVASSLGGFFAAFAGGIKDAVTGGGASLLPALFKEVSSSIDIAKGALAPLINSFITLAGLGAPLLPKLAQGFVDISTKFDNLLTGLDGDGTLKKWMDAGISGLKTLGDIVGSVTKILGGLFDAASAAGGTSIQMLADGLGKVAAVINTPALQSGLTAIFSAASQAIGGVVSALASPAFTTGLVDVFKGLLSGVTALLPVLPGVAAVLGLVGTTLGEVFKAAGPLIAQLVGMLVPAIKSLMPVIMSLIPPLAGLIQSLMPLVSALLPVVVTLFKALIPIILAVIPPVQQIITAITPLVALIGDMLIPIINALLPVVTMVFNVIAQIITAAMQIVQGIIEVVTGIITGNWSMVWNGLKDILQGVWNTIVAVIQGALGIVTSIIEGGWNWISGIFSGAWNGMVGFVSGAWGQISGAITSGIGDAISFVTGLPGQILTALGDMGSLLYQAGSDVIQGLMNGITDMAGNVAKAVGNVIGGAIDGAKKLLGIASPSKVFHQIGAWTGEGLANGMDSTATKVQSSMSGLLAIPNQSKVVSDASTMGTSLARAGAGTTSSQIINHNHITIDAKNVKDFNNVVDIINNISQVARTGRGIQNARIV